MSDIKTRTMEEAFYLQTKAFLEKNSEHINEIARLKAEVERLTEFTTRTIIPNELLQAEVERLTKAGDALAQELIVCYSAEGYDPSDSDTLTKWFSAKWNAAKDGKGL